MRTRKTNDALQGHVDVGRAYNMAQIDVASLIALIAEEAKRHAEHARKAGLAWTHVGDVAEVRRALVEVLAQFAQQDRQLVWRRVAAMRKAGK